MAGAFVSAWVGAWVGWELVHILVHTYINIRHQRSQAVALTDLRQSRINTSESH
jgi:hypothetical protein